MNFCSKCGGQNAQGIANCAFCGTSLPGGGVNPNAPPAGQQPFNQPNPAGGGFNNNPPPNSPNRQSNGLGITGFVLGIIGIVAMCCGIAPLLGIPAIICSALQMKKNRTTLAIVGLILGIIAVTIGTIAAIFFWPVFIEGFREGWNYALDAAVRV